MSGRSGKNYILLYLAFLIYSASSVCAKFASQQSLIMKLALFLILEAGCLGLYAILWQQVLKHFSLVTAMSSKGVVVIFNIIWAFLLFGEKITFYNIIGAFVIIYGIWMVSSDD